MKIMSNSIGKEKTEKFKSRLDCPDCSPSSISKLYEMAALPGMKCADCLRIFTPEEVNELVRINVS